MGFLSRRNCKKCFMSDCEERVPTRWLMCTRHWDMVPTEIQFEVYNTLRIWQKGGDPHAYITAIKHAAVAVAEKEARHDERKIDETEETHPADRLAQKPTFLPEISDEDARMLRLCRETLGTLSKKGSIR